ncbi:Coq4 family protein [Sphingomonas montanisoli]|uniref:Ubiquinone biosynthesis protein n=1 Tax=Sphingomonas montanisoli TaxID=2606412 RepID=A0A5D9BXN1_9SPHN|nr:Coq4 family protein [Sphingomonas montanisoli]TZG24126.1 hypothetical protein FYJ91_20035 [Sphingomonas montanisoli]
MNEMTTIEKKETGNYEGGMTADQAAYMRMGMEPVAGSVPMSTSKYLNSPLYVHAFTTMSLRRMGHDLPTTYDIPNMSRALADVADLQEGTRLIAEEREKNPEFAAWLDARKPVTLSLDRVKDCAPGTLGAALREFLGKGYKADFVHNYEPKSDLDYLMKRIGHTHDLQHLLTGFGPNHGGEHALAYMNIASTYKHFTPEFASFLTMANKFVSVALLTRVGLHYPQAMNIILEATRWGIEAGQNLKTLLFMVDYDSYYDWQIDDIVKDLGITFGPDAGWDYTEELCKG